MATKFELGDQYRSAIIKYKSEHETTARRLELERSEVCWCFVLPLSGHQRILGPILETNLALV
jgi:hypothetical protein